MAEGTASLHLTLDRVECLDCGASIHDDPSTGTGHVHRWRYASGAGDGQATPPAPRSELRLGWLRRLEWWLNVTGTADVHAVGITTELLHPPDQRCWSSYCSHCAGHDR